VNVADKNAKNDLVERLPEIIAAHERMQNDDPSGGMTASEALAFFLRIFLRELGHAEKTRKAPPVRAMNLVPRSLNAEIAMDLLNSCGTWAYPPGTLLNSLIRELLNLNHDKQGMSRKVDAQEEAADILARDPSVRTRELARALHVNASTISRWRRSPEFKQRVERKTEALKDSAKAGERLLSFAQQGPMEKEAIALLLATTARLYGPDDTA
jgi:hypothetical protein